MALPDILARPFHAKELREQFDTGGEWAADTYTADITTQNGAVSTDVTNEISDSATAIYALIDATSLSTPEKDALKDDVQTEMEALRVAILASLNTNLPDSLPLPIVTALEAAYQTYKTEDETAHDFTCPQCSGAGKVPIYDATGTPTGDYRECPLSDGYGNTEIEYVVDPSTLTYIPA
jgi:hypothetical protein